MSRRFLFALITLLMFSLASLPYKQIAVGQGAMTPPPTPAQSLEAQAGFSSPVLDDLQQKGMRWVNEQIAFTAFGHYYRLLSFSPIGVPNSEGTTSFGAAMLFQVDHKIGKLLWRKDVGSEWTILDGKHAETASWPSPGDWEKNGQIDFGVLFATGNTCASSVLNVYVLSSDGNVRSRLKNLIPVGHVVRSVEIPENGSLLLRADDERADMVRCGIPLMFRFFEVSGTKLTDVSMQHQDAYMDMLGQLIYTASTWKSLPDAGDYTNSEWYSSKLMKILLIYDELGNRAAGYDLVENFAAEAIKTGRVKPNTYLDQIFLPAMAQLYEQNQPFIEPAYIGPNPLQQYNYYQED